MSPLQRSDFHTRESRRKILHDEFGFWCNCNLCEISANHENLEQNDSERKTLILRQTIYLFSISLF